MSIQVLPLSFIKSTSAPNAIFLSGLVGGILDATAGVIFYFIFLSLNPLQVLQYIASGVFGPSVIGGSLIYVLAGLVLHFIIAFVAAAVFFLHTLKSAYSVNIQSFQDYYLA